MQLQRHVDHALGVFGGGHLGHGGLGRHACLAGVAQPGRAVGEQRGAVHQCGHLAQLGLRQLKVGQGLAEHLALLGMRDRLGQRAARHAQGGGGHAGAEDVQRLHGQLEATVDLTQHLLATHAAALEHQGGQRVRRHHRNVGRVVQARCAGIDNEGADATAAACGVGLGEHAVEVGDAAVADPGLAAVQKIRIVFLACNAIGASAGSLQFHSSDVRAGLGLGQRESRDLGAAGHLRQIGLALAGAAAHRDGAAAQPLHGKGKVSQRRVKRQRLAQQHQRARVELRQRAATVARHAIAQPAARPQAPHPVAAGGAVVALVHLLRSRPGRQARGDVAMGRIKEGQVQMGGAGGHGRGSKSKTERRGRKGFAEGAEGFRNFFVSASSAKPLRSLRSCLFTLQSPPNTGFCLAAKAS